MRDRLTFVDPVAYVAPPPPLVDEVHERVDVRPGGKSIFFAKGKKGFAHESTGKECVVDSNTHPFNYRTSSCPCFHAGNMSH